VGKDLVALLVADAPHPAIDAHGPLYLRVRQADIALLHQLTVERFAARRQEVEPLLIVEHHVDDARLRTAFIIERRDYDRVDVLRQNFQEINGFHLQHLQIIC